MLRIGQQVMKRCECVFIELTVCILVLKGRGTPQVMEKCGADREAVAGNVAWSHLLMGIFGLVEVSSSWTCWGALELMNQTGPENCTLKMQTHKSVIAGISGYTYHLTKC